MSSKGKASKTTTKATTDEEDRKLTKCTDQDFHDCVDDIGTMPDATAADCTALRPLALKLATVYMLWKWPDLGLSHRSRGIATAGSVRDVFRIHQFYTGIGRASTCAA